MSRAAASIRAALAAARADVGTHANERIYNNGYADGLAAALAIVDPSPVACNADGQCPYHASGGPETVRCGADTYAGVRLR